MDLASYFAPVAGRRVGIVGVTGAVGKEMLLCLTKRGWTPAEIKCFASERSAGGKVTIAGVEYPIHLFSVQAAQEMDVVFLAVSGEFALEHARVIAEKTLVIDNSSALRQAEDVPLVVPEVNGLRVLSASTRLVANPNCTTAIAMMALAPLHEAFGLKRVIVSSYQATSGAGVAGMSELVSQTQVALGHQDIVETGLVPPALLQAKTFKHPIAFNLIPHIDAFQPNGYTKEEMKVTWETRKILSLPSLPVSCTAVRIPILRAHSEAITIETERPCPAAEARAVLGAALGCKLVDTTESYPMPLHASGKDDVEVGRVRQSLVFGDTGLDFFVSGDQLLRGAALNAVLIAEMVFRLQDLQQEPQPNKKLRAGE